VKNEAKFMPFTKLYRLRLNGCAIPRAAVHLEAGNGDVFLTAIARWNQNKKAFCLVPVSWRGVSRREEGER
jgi:hypothetical protein